jgi:hypothetical protein
VEELDSHTICTTARGRRDEASTLAMHEGCARIILGVLNLLFFSAALLALRWLCALLCTILAQREKLARWNACSVVSNDIRPVVCVAVVALKKVALFEDAGRRQRTNQRTKELIILLL